MRVPVQRVCPRFVGQGELHRLSLYRQIAFIATSPMDFQVGVGAGVGAGAAAALAARGADPAIAVPAGPHFFRRIQGLVLSPIPGALVPVPTTLPQSVVELVLAETVTTDGVQALADQPAIMTKVLPTKLEISLAQLEAEPAGVGLDPTTTYEDLDEAAAAVRAAMARVKALDVAAARPPNPAYVLAAGDCYALEPIANPAAPAALVALTVAPTALTLGQLSDGQGYLLHFGFIAFLCMGCSQSGTRDGPGSPTRNTLVLLSQLAAREE